MDEQLQVTDICLLRSIKQVSTVQTMAAQSKPRQDKAVQNKTMQHNPEQCNTIQNMSRQGTAEQNMAIQTKAAQTMASQDKAKQNRVCWFSEKPARNKMKQKRKITCSHCKHSWETRATTIMVTCSSCQLKTKNVVGGQK